ncbi:MAG: TRAP transporter substrate-binding protein DctP [Gammaproteobacteria bacterium]|nr:TRAP transporter substrate-binding protein DctP [Gammaproteobacteria bacterium]MDH3537842.1 TRAP transporter substrate-binding protein DctP [Gammaproteobacteria bacterium]
MKTTLITPCLVVMALAFSASVDANTLKIATLAPAGTTWMKEMQAGAKLIEERSAGRVKLKFYPGGVMGNDQSVHRKIRIGQLQGGAFTQGGLAQVDTSIQSLGLPMMFKSLDEVDYVRQRIDPVLAQRMESQGFVILGITEGGFARILSRQPMQSLESLRASRVWVPEGDKVGQTVFRALGISPISLPISDVFTGLQTGLIETIAVNPTSAIAFQWHTSTSYMTDVPVTYLIGVLAVEKDAFGKLSAQDQAIVREEMDKVFKRMNAINRADNEAAKQALQQHGITFVMPNPGETERWRTLADHSIEEMVQTGVIPGEIVGQIRDLLQSFRNSQ